MYWDTEDATMVCSHQSGNVAGFSPSQSWVTITKRRVLVEPDPVGRTIGSCNNLPPLGKPCTTTMDVMTGYSGLIKIDGKRVCMSNLTGKVDAPSPPYTTRAPGQTLVGTDT